MELVVDIHSHSAFAGGARAGGKTVYERDKRVKKRFIDSAKFSPLKGINILGTGDAQYEPWLKFLSDNLEEVNSGIFSYEFSDEELNFIEDRRVEYPNYLLQTELIFTGPVPITRRRKKVHVVILFPNITRIEELNDLLDSWGVARQKIARPFIVNKDVEDIDKKINQILDIDDGIEIIPAHILTPEGVYGGNERVNQLIDFFGNSASRFNAVETGLSADPSILGLIPELDNFTLLSNSDAHSAALNRIGREFTILEVNNIKYQDIIRSIRMNKVVKTAEFHPTEGRYFLTGHRAGRKKPGVHKKDEYCFYSPKFVPKNDLCPICGKELTIGVLQRAYEIGKSQGEMRKIGDGPKRDYLTMVPLIEIISHSMGIKSVSSKRVLDIYKRIISVSGTEVNLWNTDITKDLTQSNIPEILIENILDVSKGNFSFFPGGYDGEYGQLKIGTTIDFENVEVLNYG